MDSIAAPALIIAATGDTLIVSWALQQAAPERRLSCYARSST
jgi:hypothetical protein